MSSNLELKRVCQHCGVTFISEETTTKFCSLQCGQRNYKMREKMNRIANGNAQTRAKVLQPDANAQAFVSAPEQDFIDIKMLAFVTSLSERKIFLLIKEDPEFPKLKIGSRLLFNKKAVIEYLIKKYGNW